MIPGVVLLSALLVGNPASRPVAPVHILALRVTHPPNIDGHLDEPEWREAPISQPFAQHYPDPDRPASERTEVRVLYDDSSLYVGIDCTQLTSPVVKRLARRDSQLHSDEVWLDIDSRHDGSAAFHFGVNAAGVLNDGVYFTDSDYSSDWDGIWEAHVADTDHGYSIEFRIPFKTLGSSTASPHSWGLQVGRLIDALQETDSWSPYPRGATAYLPYFGELEGLSDVTPTVSLDLIPFLLGRVRHRTNDVSTDGSTQPGLGGVDFSSSAGLNARLRLTDALSVDLTLNPDFGQVEVDTLVLNLSTIETFFPEKRPFFLAGLDLFSTLQPLLYTRRIGQQPTPVLAPAEILFGTPEPAPIYGAAKLVGTLGTRTTVGALSAVTGPNAVAIQTSAGTIVQREEPLAAYNVLRVKSALTQTLVIGAMATAVTRFEQASPHSPCSEIVPEAAGPRSWRRCFNDAYTWSLDGKWRSLSSDYYVAAQAIATTLRHGPLRLERDGLPVQPGALSGLGTLLFGKDGGTHWFYTVGQLFSGRQYETNDAGFNDRKNEYQSYYTLSYRTLTPWWRTLETRTRLQLDLHRTGDGIDLGSRVGLTTLWTFDRFWTASVNVHYAPRYFDDREMGDGTALERAGGTGMSASIDTDPRRRVVGHLFAEGDRLTNGTHCEMHGSLTLRFRPQFEMDIMPTGMYDNGAPRNIATLSDVSQPISPSTPGRYLLGVQQASSIGLSAQLAYTLSPSLSLQLFAQLFLARIHYSGFFTATVAGPRNELRLADLLPTTPPDTAVDARDIAFNMNAVIRWEYRLGSTLYVVYTRSQNPPVGASHTTIDFRPILQGHAAVDVVMVKLAYWWG